MSLTSLLHMFEWLIFLGWVENSDATLTNLVPNSVANNGHAFDMQIKWEGIPTRSSL